MIAFLQFHVHIYLHISIDSQCKFVLYLFYSSIYIDNLINIQFFNKIMLQTFIHFMLLICYLTTIPHQQFSAKFSHQFWFDSFVAKSCLSTNFIYTVIYYMHTLRYSHVNIYVLFEWRKIKSIFKGNWMIALTLNIVDAIIIYNIGLYN